MPLKKVTSYLSNLRFDPALYDTWYAKYLVQVRLVLMLVLSIVAVGLFSYFNLPRRLNPEVKIPIVVVSTILPGASPEDIETLITVPLEEKLNNLKGIDALTSSSFENGSAITMQFLSNVDADQAKNDVQSAVDSVVNLPSDATDPEVTKLDFEDAPIWNFAITTDKDTASLNRLSIDLKKKIEDIAVVDRVTTSGIDTQELEVVLSPEKIREYNISPLALAQIIQRSTNSFPAGNVQTGTFTFPISIEKDVTTIEDIRNLEININQKPVRLGEIAAVSLRSTPNQKLTLFGLKDQENKKAVQFFIYKSSSSNIDQAEEIVSEEVEKYLESHPDYQLITVSNAAEEITEQFNDLTKDFFTTVLLVFTLLLVFLGLKQAIISSFTVPLTFLSTFAIMNVLGLSINFLTMFAFLIALGLLIDDTIVTVAAMTRYYSTGKFSPTQSGILVWRDFIVPLWSTTITTIWAFVPLLIASGIIGEFIKSIPLVVTATMLSSTSIAVLITLPLMIVFLKPVFPARVIFLAKILAVIIGIILIGLFAPKNILFVPIFIAALTLAFITFRGRQTIIPKVPTFIRNISNHGLIDIEVLSRKYMNLIRRILDSQHGKRNTLIGITAFALCAYLLVPLGFVKNEFFPKQDTNLLYVSIELPAGTNLEVANQEVVNLLNKVKNTPEVKFAVAESGAGFAGGMGRSSSGNGVLVTLHLTEIEDRIITSYEIAENLRRDLADYSKGTLTVQELSGGPPVGADIQITLLGDDLTTLDSYANKVIEFLKTQPGVTNANKSIKPGTSKIVFTPEKEKLLENGLTADALSLWLRTFATGFTLESIKLPETHIDEEQDITFRMSDGLQTPEDIGSINIPTQNGSVPLLSLGKLSLSSNPTLITRESGKRSITVTAGVAAGSNIPEKNSALLNFTETQLNLEPGYTWKTGGANEENQESVNSIIQAMLISFLLILITMVVEFRSFRQTFIALMIIPLSIAGVLYVFALTNTPLSFPALIGLLALFGIVVTHAIVVIEKINDNLREKLPLKEAIIDAAGNRLEPVLLTSMATIAGLIPITLSDPLWRGLGGAIIAGLLFSGAIKLFFVPVTYYLFFKDDPKDKNLD